MPNIMEWVDGEMKIRPATPQEEQDLAAHASTEADTVASYMAAVQRHMDAAARAAGYDDLLSVISYADEPAVERYQNEGRAFRAWRSRCWFACETVLGDVQRGERQAPSTDELLLLLPAVPA